MCFLLFPERLYTWIIVLYEHFWNVNHNSGTVREIWDVVFGKQMNDMCVCVFERVSLWFCSCLYQVFSGLNFTSAICSFFHSIQNSVYVKTKPQKFTGGDPFLNRLKTYIVFCRVPVMCAAKTIQLKALTRPSSHSVLPFGAIPSGFPSPVTVAKVCSVPLLNIYKCYWCLLLGGV